MQGGGRGVIKRLVVVLVLVLASFPPAESAASFAAARLQQSRPASAFFVARTYPHACTRYGILSSPTALQAHKGSHPTITYSDSHRLYQLSGSSLRHHVSRSSLLLVVVVGARGGQGPGVPARRGATQGAQGNGRLMNGSIDQPGGTDMHPHPHSHPHTQKDAEAHGLGQPRRAPARVGGRSVLPHMRGRGRLFFF